MAFARGPFAEILSHRASDARGERWFTPAVDILEDDDAVLVRVELPGVRPEDLHVDTRERMLTVRGERRLEHAGEPERYHRRERSFGAFSRTFQLPEHVDGDGAVAVIADGVLTVRIPKRAMRCAS